MTPRQTGQMTGFLCGPCGPFLRAWWDEPPRGSGSSFLRRPSAQGVCEGSRWTKESPWEYQCKCHYGLECAPGPRSAVGNGGPSLLACLCRCSLLFRLSRAPGADGVPFSRRRRNQHLPQRAQRARVRGDDEQPLAVAAGAEAHHHAVLQRVLRVRGCCAFGCRNQTAPHALGNVANRTSFCLERRRRRRAAQRTSTDTGWNVACCAPRPRPRRHGACMRGFCGCDMGWFGAPRIGGPSPHTKAQTRTPPPARAPRVLRAFTHPIFRARTPFSLSPLRHRLLA